MKLLGEFNFQTGDLPRHRFSPLARDEYRGLSRGAKPRTLLRGSSSEGTRMNEREIAYPLFALLILPRMYLNVREYVNEIFIFFQNLLSIPLKRNSRAIKKLHITSY